MINTNIIILSIIIISLFILFLLSNKANQQTTINEPFKNKDENKKKNKKKTSSLDFLSIGESYKNTLNNGENIYDKLKTHNNLKNDEYEDLLINIKVDVDKSANIIYTDFLSDKINMKNIDNYLQKTFYNKLNNSFTKYKKLKIVDELIIEVEYILQEKMIDYIENKKSPGNTDNLEAFFIDIGVNRLSDQVDKGMEEATEAGKILEKKELFNYIISKLSIYDPEELDNKLTEQFISESQVNTITKPGVYDQLTANKLGKIYEYQQSKAPPNINNVLIDPLKLIQTTQDDLLNIFSVDDPLNDNLQINKSRYISRGSLLVDSKTPKYTNINYKSNEIENHPYILNTSSNIEKILKDKETDINEIKSRNYLDNEEETIEGFNNIKNNSSDNNSLNTIDNLIGYITNNIFNLLNNIFNNNNNSEAFKNVLFNIKNLNNQKFISYGILLIFISIILFLLSF